MPYLAIFTIDLSNCEIHETEAETAQKSLHVNIFILEPFRVCPAETLPARTSWAKYESEPKLQRCNQYTSVTLQTLKQLGNTCQPFSILQLG
jgi:hypothetical protein